MRLVSPILQKVVYPALGKTGYFHRRSAPFTVITYHGVLPEGYESKDSLLDGPLLSADAFRAQLRLLKKHYRPITPETFFSCLQSLEALQPGSVLLTCDDGLLNNLTVMLPILQEERLSCLFFVTGKSVEDTPDILWYVQLYLMLMQARPGEHTLERDGVQVPAVPTSIEGKRQCWLTLMRELSRFSAEERSRFLREAARCWELDRCWKEKVLKDAPFRQRFQLMTSSDLKELSSAGMEIGAHTISHPVLSMQSADLARTEIADCKTTLERCIGKPVRAMAYPFGDPASVGVREYEFAQAAAYDCAFLNVPGAFEGASVFALPRMHVTADMTLPVFEAQISGFHEQLRGRFAR